MPLYPEQAQGLLDLLYDLLKTHPEGLSEWEVVLELKKRRLSPFAQADLGDPLLLFQTHFLLFHLLYKLQAQLLKQAETLGIHCLKIQLQKRTAGGHPLEAHDPLRDYYLNWENCKNTHKNDVDQMLDQFWGDFKRHQNASEAYAVLGLPEGAPKKDIKAKYRELAQKLHPDTGGTGQGFEKITWAKQVLIP